MTSDDVRARCIEVGAQASAKAWGDPAPDKVDYVVATAVVDAVTPIIRAAEQSRVVAQANVEELQHRAALRAVEAEARERLREQARDLPSRVELDETGNEVTWVRYADVCGLLDGS
jgi:hypothetical protein